MVRTAALAGESRPGLRAACWNSNGIHREATEGAEDCFNHHLRRRGERIRLIWRIDSLVIVIPRSGSDEGPSVMSS